MHSQEQNSKTTQNTALYLGSDGTLARRLDPVLHRRHIRLVHATSPRSGRELVAGFDLLIIDMLVLDPSERLKDVVRDLREAAGRPIPLVVITQGRSIEPRLEALRADAAACLAAPVVPSELAKRLGELCRPKTQTPSRILVVEDSATQAILLERILEGAGLSVRILNDALGVIEALEDFKPDLVLMDLHMPRANGAELAAIIREQDSSATIPIVFLSDERDQEVQIHALSMGGDAFITKPIEPGLLVKALTQRIASMRTLRERMDVISHRDPDTGLASRRYFMARLERAIGDPDIEELGNGVLVLALDEVSQLAETIGTGGACLVHDRIGKLVQGCLTPADIGARLDDRHLVVLARRASDGDLLAFGEALRQTIAAYPVVIGGKTVAVTASIGIGAFRPPAQDAIELISRAGEACAQALTDGGNRVISHSPEALEELDRSREKHMARMIHQVLEHPTDFHDISLFYQPLVAVKPGRRNYLEVQPVLNVGRIESIPAEEFMPVAEHSGLIKSLDRWVMMHALDALRQQAEAQPRLRLMVLQHMVGLSERDWARWMRDQITAHGLGQRRPIIEIGLQDVLRHRQVAPLPLKMLHKIGLKVCLREVSNTPVSLDLVTDIQPQFVKLAPEVTREIKLDRLNWLVERLKRTGTEIIACGIDTPEQIGPVWASGINYAQGTLIQEPLAEPMSA